jgi:phosphatidylserine decarboxylase
MKIHREGYGIIATAFIIITGLALANYYLFTVLELAWLFWLINTVLLVLLVLVLQFFRVPNIQVSADAETVLCPADGKVVAIEKVVESEYFQDERIQVSVFMSPLNVHANFNPISGIIKYAKYHAGLFLVAWHPKSSTENERTTIVIEHANGQEVLFRQIAGAVARRICYYVEEGQSVKVGEEFGFIKFGSRVDIFLPVSTQIDVKIGDVVKGRITKLGRLK